MLSEQYLSMLYKEKTDYMAEVIITAQSQDFFVEIKEVIERARKQGLFENVKPVDPHRVQIVDIDHPIENGPSSIQN